MLRKLHHLFSSPSTRVSERNYLLPSAKVDNGESANGTDFGLRNPLEIETFLRHLATRQDFLTADYGNGQIITRVLDIDAKSKTFTFDYGASKTGNHAVLAASKLRFSALPDGVKVNFTTGKPHEISRAGIAAFEVELPKVLIRVQRREYFRVETPMLDPYFGSGALPEGQRFRLEMYDLSLGGVAFRTPDENISNLEIGVTLNGVMLHFGNQTTVALDLQLVSRRFVTTPKGGKLFMLGFRFLSLPAQAEKMLQQLIAQLEIKRGALLR